MVDAQSFFPPDHLFFNNDIYISEFEKEILLDVRAGNKPETLALLLAADSSATKETYSSINKGLEVFCSKLENKRSILTGEEERLSIIFDKIQTTYLKKYQTGQTVDKTILYGTYDCLTASAIYALVLERLGYRFNVVETPHHVYVKVFLKKGKKEILLETTDRYNGFVTDKNEIVSREKKYAAQSSGSFVDIMKTSENLLIVDSTLHAEIGIDKLCGLQYFNEGVKEYNKGNYKSAFTYIEKAFIFYPSDRINGMAILTLQQILSKKQPGDKEFKFYSNKYRSYLSMSQYLASAH